MTLLKKITLLKKGDLLNFKKTAAVTEVLTIHTLERHGGKPYRTPIYKHA